MLGPLLFLLYVNSLANLDLHLLLIMYADDTVIYAPVSRHPSLHQIKCYQDDLNKIAQWCEDNRLSINFSKTKLMILGRVRNPSQIRQLPDLRMNNMVLGYTDSYKYLGLRLNSQLTLTQHINSTIALVANKLKTFTTVRQYIGTETSLLVYKTMILPLFEYSNLVYSLVPVALRKKLQRLQNRSLRIIFFRDSHLATSQLHDKAKLVPLSQRADTQLLCLMFRRSFDNNKFPLLPPTVETRSMHKIKFQIPRPKKERFRHFPVYRGSQLWDNLPADVQQADSYQGFKSKVKIFLANSGDYAP